MPILFFIALFFIVDYVWDVPIWVAGIYLAVSVVTFGLYAIDKSAAIDNRSRISERTLIVWGILGGWPGAIIAQQLLRHKSMKRSFRSTFWWSVVANVLVLVLVLSPFFRGVVADACAELARMAA